MGSACCSGRRVIGGSVVAWSYHRRMDRFRISRALLVLALCTASLAACAADCLPTVRDGWVRVPPAGLPMAAGFGTFENPCDSAAVIVSASSPAFAETSVHATRVVDGISRMRAVPELRVDEAPEVEHLVVDEKRRSALDAECRGQAHVAVDHRRDLRAFHVRLELIDVEAASEVVPVVGDWIGKRNREDLTVPLLEFRQSLQQFGLLRKYKGKLLLTKLGTDSEIIVMNASGMSPWHLFRPFLAAAAVQGHQHFRDLVRVGDLAVRPEADLARDDDQQHPQRHNDDVAVLQKQIRDVDRPQQRAVGQLGEAHFERAPRCADRR